MPTPSEIRRKAGRVSTANDEFCRGKDRCQGYVYNSSSWWQGEAGKVLRSEYSEMQADITRLSTKMIRLENCTNKLAGNVQQADDERRRRAEAQKKQAFAAKK